MTASDTHPLLFCFIGPGASGKSSICTALAKDADLPVFLSVSSTTRTPRPYEKEGREYFFLSKQEFASRLSQGMFLEHAEFAGNLYGTEKRNIETAEQLKKNLLLDIEVQGVIQLRKAYPENIVVVFICPPSIEELRERFRSRGTDSEARINERIVLAREEIRLALSPGFSDYVIVNETLDKSIWYARGVILGEMVSRERLGSEVLARFGAA
jgi:guanylate kinase